MQRDTRYIVVYCISNIIATPGPVIFGLVSCKLVVMLCAVYAYRLCTSVMHKLAFRCRRMTDIRAT